MRRTIATVVAGLVLAPLATAAFAAPAHAGSATPTRILIVGDSVTQGRVGDYTWRYRLWNTLQAAHASVDFVGPHTGLFDASTTTYDNTGYADPNFDQDHAARWGQALAIPDYATSDLVAAANPDVILMDLGINDLTWFAETPETLIGLVTQFVSDARAAHPGVSIVLGQLSQRWDAGVPAYNDLLTNLGASLDQPGARVIVAPAPSDYVQGVDTYDPAHPTAAGEVKLAAQFAGALRQIGVGVPPAPTPTAPTAAVGAGHLAGAARRAGRVRLTWTTPAGATSQTIYFHRVGTTRWRTLRAVTPSTSHLVVRLRQHAGYVFRMRAATAPTYSNRVRVHTR